MRYTWINNGDLCGVWVGMRFCEKCGRLLVPKMGLQLCPKHRFDYIKKPRKRIGKYSGRMGEKQKDLLNGKD